MSFPAGPYITSVETFRFRNRFTSELTDQQLGEAMQVVNAQFTGVYQLWRTLPPAERDAKRELCISYLVAWALVQNYPNLAIGVSGSGALPLKSKHVGPVTITYRDSIRQGSGVLDILTTNEFGYQALLLMQTAPEMYLVYR